MSKVRTLVHLAFVAVALGFGAVAAQAEHQVLMHIEEVPERPLPPTVCLTTIGLYSAMGRSKDAAVSSATPRAWPRRMALSADRCLKMASMAT